MIYRGRVTRVSGSKIYLQIPKLGAGVEYGPCQSLAPPAGDQTEPGGADAHRHALAYAYKAGDAVLVASIADVKDDLVVIGRLR